MLYSDTESVRTSRAKQVLRANPTGAILTAVGIGLAIGLIIRAAQPKAPTNRVQAILEDIEERLNELKAPVARKAAALADEGVSLLHSASKRVEKPLHRFAGDIRKHWHDLVG